MDRPATGVPDTTAPAPPDTGQQASPDADQPTNAAHPNESDAPRGGAPRRRLGRNVVALLSAQIVTWTVSTLVMVIVPNIVGPESIGHYRIAMSLWAVAGSFVALGTSTLVTLEVARRQDDRTVHLGPVILARLLGYAAVWIPIIVIMITSGYSSDVVVLMVVVGAGVLISTVGEVARAALTGHEHLAPVAAADVMSKVLGAVLMIGAAVVTREIVAVAIVGVASFVAYSVYLFRSLRKIVEIDFSASLTTARAVIRRGLPYFMIGLTVTAYQQLDVVVMSYFVTDVEIGWYATADVLFGTLLFVPSVLMTALLPMLARSHERDPDAGKAVLEQSFRSLLVIAVPLGLGIVIVADSMTRLLYGDEFDGTGPVLAVFGVVLIFTFQTILLAQHALSTNRQRFWNIVMLVAVAMTVPLDVVLIPWTESTFDNGAIGGALAFVVTESMMVVVGLTMLAPHLASWHTLTRLLKCLVAGAAMVAACWPLRDMVVAVPVAVGIVVYCAVFALLRPFDQAERAVIERVAKKLPSLRRV